jgi:hypothetical protein
MRKWASVPIYRSGLTWVKEPEICYLPHYKQIISPERIQWLAFVYYRFAKYTGRDGI